MGQEQDYSHRKAESPGIVHDGWMKPESPE